MAESVSDGGLAGSTKSLMGLGVCRLTQSEVRRLVDI